MKRGTRLFLSDVWCFSYCVVVWYLYDSQYVYMYSAGPKEDSLYEWVGSIKGPQGSVYEGGTFLLDIKFSPDYPFKPPKVNIM